MARILFLPNEHTMIWLAARPAQGGLPALAERVRAGRWGLPRALVRRFRAAPQPVLHARICGEVLVVWPAQPLFEHGPAQPPANVPAPVDAPMELTPMQRRILALSIQGLTQRQIGVLVGYSERWIGEQLRGIKRGWNLQARARIARGLPRD